MIHTANLKDDAIIVSMVFTPVQLGPKSRQDCNKAMVNSIQKDPRSLETKNNRKRKVSGILHSPLKRLGRNQCKKNVIITRRFASIRILAIISTVCSGQ